MNKRLLILLLAIVCLGAVGVATVKYWPQQNVIQPVNKTTIYLNWIFAGSYGGEVLGSQQFAAANGLAIQLQEGGQGLDPLKLIRKGEFGIAAADEIIRAIVKGAPYVIIGVLNDDSPTAFASIATANIHAPRDFVGKRIGILPFGSTGLVYQSLLKRNGIDRSQITEVVVSPDLRPFVAKAYDVQPIFIFDETVSLDQQGIQYNLVVPKDWGVSFKGMAYFTMRETIEQNPDLVYRFVKTMTQGWTNALASPTTAITELQRLAPKVDAQRELKVLERAAPYFGTATRKPLTSDPASWNHMIEDMVSFGVIDRDIGPREFVDLSFIDKAYRE